MPTDEFTVTPYHVEGTVDYDRLLEQFGADPLTPEQRAAFPGESHPLVRRDIFYAHRDVDDFLAAATASRPHSVVTGRGPSGPMHLGHILPFYFAKYLQSSTGATVYLPVSDDEKYYLKDQTITEISDATRDNLRDLLAVGFDPERTRIIVDSADADVIYSVAMLFAKEITQATVDATYGDPQNIGLSFYPAVQTAHLLLPQLVDGRQPTLVPIAIDQDTHVRLCRDIAAKDRFPVQKPAALLSKFLPQLSGPGKMSASDDAPSISLTDDRDTVFEKIRTHAYSGGQSSVDAHRKQGGDPSVDVAYQYLYYFFEDDDDRIEELANAYRDGRLLSGELKDLAAARIADFLADHQQRRQALDSIDSELEPFRLTAAERRQARSRVGYPDTAIVEQ